MQISLHFINRPINTKQCWKLPTKCFYEASTHTNLSFATDVPRRQRWLIEFFSFSIVCLEAGKQHVGLTHIAQKGCLC